VIIIQHLCEKSAQLIHRFTW